MDDDFDLDALLREEDDLMNEPVIDDAYWEEVAAADERRKQREKDRIAKATADADAAEAAVAGDAGGDTGGEAATAEAVPPAES
jgi:hypothetical protein